jgi:2-polyprenyl-3-methyl-5-hydroxy-6-metoxy-1,4-benzoquinol methylase
MKISELVYDKKEGLFLNPEHIIDYSDGEENEKYVYDTFKNADDNSIFSPYIFDRIRDWSSEYHFTTYRANILRPLDIKKEHSVLEIGAGCGAITRYLGETGASITSVEGSLSRAKCARQRSSDLDNVMVICSNVENLEFEQQYDIVTLIGVFEYTAKYSQRKDPFNAALRYYRNLLKPNGSLVIAIENKLGLKYFAGYNEDHTSTPYYGIEGRYHEKDVTTFGRREIEHMLNGNGFHAVDFLYPFPDYKLPKVIISDKGFNNSRLKAADLIRSTKNRHYSPRTKANTINEDLIYDSLVDNGIMRDMSNSFLIVASPDQGSSKVDPSLLAHYYTCNRHEPFNTFTSFLEVQSEIRVAKHRLGQGDELNTAVGSILEKNEQTHHEYIYGDNLHYQIKDALFKKHYLEYDRLMKVWVDFLKDTVLEPDNDEIVRPEYFDALPFNLIQDAKNNFHLFDQEWIVRETFDLTFLVVRYLSMFKKTRGVYSGYSASYLGFLNKSLSSSGLKPISRGKLRKMERLDESVRKKINRTGGMAPLQIMKSLVFLGLYKLKEIKNYLHYGLFAQR